MPVNLKKLSVKIGKLFLSTPLIASSGTFGYGQEAEGMFDFDCFGALTTKTVTLKFRAGNPAPRLVETACGLLNSIGLDNPGIEIFLREKWPYLEKLKTPVIVSIAGETIEEFVQLVKQLDKISSLKAIEVNISCPNIKKAHSSKLKTHSPIMFSQDEKATFDVVSAVRRKTKKTLIIKLTPNVTDIVRIALKAVNAGADALSLVNTYYGMAVDINTRKPRLANISGGLSGPAIKPLSIYSLYKVKKAVDVPIIAGGGIMAPDDAIEFLICGATALSLGTINFIDTKAPGRLLSGIEQYLKKHRIKSIKNLTASLLI